MRHKALLVPILTFAMSLCACQTLGGQTPPTMAATAELPDPSQSGVLVAGAITPEGFEPAGVMEIPTVAEPSGTGTAAAEQPAAATLAPSATSAATAMPTEPPTPEPSPTPAGPQTYTYEVVANFPHDPNAWTQGLVIDQGTLFEGTGKWGESGLREVALDTGAVLRSVPLDPQYFGEGITVLGDRIFQLTWQEETGFVYDRNTFELLQTFTYPTEGWGITTDGTRLIVSDGTSTIYFWDPATLTEIGRIEVRDNLGPVNMLNELEYVNGEIWANIWLEDRIARISPETGMVTGWIDMTGLLDPATLTQPADVLNGIALDAATGNIYVTGKYWPAMFQINVIPTG